MKQGKPVITVVMVALAVALAIYFGFHVFDTFNDPFSTTMVYTYTVNDSVEAEGLLVREEQVLPAQDLALWSSPAARARRWAWARPWP